MFTPRATVRRKMVTSGRLTGAISKVQTDKTRRSTKSRPEPAYSLYSTDSENQVATLHKGLDCCAALLSDILQCENQGAASKQDGAVKDAGPKNRPHTPTGKKATRRSLSKSVSNPQSAEVVRRKSYTKPSATTLQCSSAPTHCCVKLHPPVRKAYLLKTSSKPPSPQPLYCSPVTATQAITALDCMPERDLGPAGNSGEEEVAQVESKMRRVQSLLGELRTLMVGHGDSAQTYLHLLEQIVSSALSSETSKNQALSTSRNQAESTEAQLQRQVNVLTQQLQDQEVTRQLLNSQVLGLQEQLSVAEKEQLHVRTSFQETQSTLQSREEENLGLIAELESTRGRLRATLQDKIKMEGRLQQKQQEIQALQRIINSLDLSLPTPEHQPACPPGCAKKHIIQDLLSLEQSQATQPPGYLLRPLGLDLGPERNVDSVISDWSVQSESSVSTRDEAAFRDRLAALDASIASLQKTIKMDLVKS